MELDKFEQFIKDGQFEPNLNAVEAKTFNLKLYNSFRDKHDDIASDVNGTIGFDEIYNNSLYQVESLNVVAMDHAITYHTNELIKTTLKDIEDIEEYNKTEVEPEDCMDTIKRHWELDHD